MAALFSVPSTVLVNRLPAVRYRAVLLVLSATALTAALAQLTIRLPWTPVPITGQTAAVLIAGGALGWRLGSLSQLLYVAIGSIGLPVFASGGSGFASVTGATGGYLVGFIFAAALVGLLAERRQDRSFLTCMPALLAGNAIVYLVGVPWLAASLNVSATKALELGFVPFVVGDLFKLLLVGGALPATWRVLSRRNDDL